MKMLLLSLGFIALLQAPAYEVAAQNKARVMSVPFATSADHIYKVRIESIDGTTVPEALWHNLAPGKHVLSLALMLDVEWLPDLRPQSAAAYVHEFSLTVDRGKTYHLAAKVDIDAPAESQLDGSFWQPIVMRVIDH